MAFTLNFEVTERNDNKLLTITDTTGEISTGTSTGWGIPNPLYTNIGVSGSTTALELDIKITESDGVETTYDTIDLYTEFGPFVTVDDMVFELDCSMLKVSGIAIGTSDDELPDGIYEIQYTYASGEVTETYTVDFVLVYGKVKKGVYELLRKMNTDYEYEGAVEDDVLLTIFTKTYLDGILAADAVARRDSVIEQLYTLERLLINESSYEI
jgi:hypothetical protein